MDMDTSVDNSQRPSLPRRILDVNARDIAWIIAGMLLAYVATLV